MKELVDFVCKIITICSEATPMAVAVLALLVALSVVWLK